MAGWRVGLAVALAGCSAMAWAAPADAPNSAFTGGDLFNLSRASDVQISPDGRQVAYVRLTGDIMTDRAQPSIWLVEVASGRQQPLVAGGSSPRWSPDGGRIAYVAAADGGAQLFIRWLASGASAKITGLPDINQR